MNIDVNLDVNIDMKKSLNSHTDIVLLIGLHHQECNVHVSIE